MGSIGANSNTVTSVKDRLEGSSINELNRYVFSPERSLMEANKAIREDFGLDFATEKQIDAIRTMFKDMLEYDKSYGDDSKPFTIDSIEIRRMTEQSPEELARNKELFGRTNEIKDIWISITTKPDDDRAVIRMMDTKYRIAALGKGGGFYIYNKNGKRQSIRPFDMGYGSREL